MDDLFAAQREPQILAPGAMLLPGFARDLRDALNDAIAAIIREAPLRHLVTPGGGRMSVASTSCGDWGWYSDERGYRYTRDDPQTGHRWPAMPDLFRDVARRAAAVAGYDAFAPQSCLVNCYRQGAGMGLHQDRDEGAPEQPIVSISLGAAARFDFGGLQRSDPLSRIELLDGDVVVWGGVSRMAWHGLAPLRETLRSGSGITRYNLTFRAINAARFRP